MKRLTRWTAILLTAVAGSAGAQQASEFGDYVVHYNVLGTNLLAPQVAQGYGIQRSPSRALLNVTVIRRIPGGEGLPVRASVLARARNLTGQRREIPVREITDTGGAVYYIGEFPVRNMETFDFSVTVVPVGEPEPLEVRFRQQFYTE
jgi:hypothetical protein